MATYKWHSLPRVQLAVLWEGIESLFPISAELSFRISLYTALFLAGDDKSVAKQVFENTKELYNARSAAVHGGKIKGNEATIVAKSADLLNQLIRKCAEKRSIPQINNLLFK